jgi:hypothetical protein
MTPALDRAIELMSQVPSSIDEVVQIGDSDVGMEAVQVTETVDEASYSLEAMNLASLGSVL